MNLIELLQEINANYQAIYESRYCSKCGGFRAHLIAYTFVPVTHEQVRRVECTQCHIGETRLIASQKSTKGETQ